MKNIIIKLLAVIFYIFIVLYSLHFDFRQLWDTKTALLVLSGTLLLTAASLRPGTNREQARRTLGQNAMVAAYITTFIEIYTRMFSWEATSSQISRMIAVSCRALLYGYILNTALRPVKPAEAIPEGEEKKAEDAYRQSASDLAESGEEILRGAGLTARETEIALLAAKDFSNKQIADKLFISETTVKKHMSNIFAKLDISSRGELKNIENGRTFL